MALESGETERSLELLRRPDLALSLRASELRQAALEHCCREARRLAATDASADVAGIIARVSIDDPTRASLLRRELGLAMRGLAMRGNGARITGVLAHVRAARSSSVQRASSCDDRAPRTATIHTVIAASESASPSGGEIVRFHVAVDDGGEFFVAGGASLTLGHLRSPDASLPFLADVESRHARFVFSESFHAGPRWSIEPLDARDVRLNGERLEAAGRALADGDDVVLARNLALRFRQPDAASGSALLELAAGSECLGVRRIVLLAPGEAGRVRIGSKSSRHIPVPDLAHEIVLEWSRGELAVSCAGGVRLGGAPAVANARSISIPCPPHAASSFVLGAREKVGPPFAIHVRPMDPRARGGDPRARGGNPHAREGDPRARGADPRPGAGNERP